MPSSRQAAGPGCGRTGADARVVADDDPDAFAAAPDRCLAAPALRAELGKQARQSFPADTTREAVLPQIERVHAGLRELGEHLERPGS